MIGKNMFFADRLNEWHEGSEIEPSVELGRTYLDATKRWIAWWRHQ